MTERAYPFVVARNRTLDWRAVVAPDELIAANEDYALVLQTGEEHPAPVTVRTWQDHSAKTWVLCYRSVPADPGFVGEDRPGLLTDKFGRELYIIEGVVLSGSSEPSLDRARELVERVHDDAVSAFRDFWSEEDEAVPPIASAPLGTGDAPAAHRGLEEQPPADPATGTRAADGRVAVHAGPTGWQSLLRGRGLAIAGGLLAVVIALAWLAVRTFGMGGAGG